MPDKSFATLTGLLLVAIAAISWGTTGTTLKLVGASSAAVPLVVGATRMLVAAPLLAAGAGVARISLRPSNSSFLLAGVCMAGYQVCFFSAVPLAGVAATALLAICSAPILIALLARIFLHERLTPLRLIAMALGVVGAGLLVGSGPPGHATGAWGGGALALGAGLAYSAYAVTTKAALNTSAPIGLSALTFTVAALILLPVFAFQPAVTQSTLARAWPFLVYLGAIPTAAAYWLYTAGLRRVPAGSAAVAGLLEPLTATALGVALFAEHLGPTQLVGAALLLIAMAILAIAASQTGPQTPAH